MSIVGYRQIYPTPSMPTYLSRRIESELKMKLTTSWKEAPRIDGPVQARLKFSSSPFSIVHNRRLAVKREVPDIP